MLARPVLADEPATPTPEKHDPAKAMADARQSLAESVAKYKALPEADRKPIEEAMKVLLSDSEDYKSMLDSMTAMTKVLFIAAACDRAPGNETRTALARKAGELTRDIVGVMKGEPCPAGCCEFVLASFADEAAAVKSAEETLAEVEKLQKAMDAKEAEEKDEEEMTSEKVEAAMQVLEQTHPATSAMDLAFLAVSGAVSDILSSFGSAGAAAPADKVAASGHHALQVLGQMMGVETAAAGGEGEEPAGKEEGCEDKPGGS